MFGIGICQNDDAAGRAAACKAARWYYGDNDAELNAQRFTTAGGVAAVRARISAQSDEQLIANGMAVGGNPNTVCRIVEQWAGTGIDQFIFFMQAGHGPARRGDALDCADRRPRHPALCLTICRGSGERHAYRDRCHRATAARRPAGYNGTQRMAGRRLREDGPEVLGSQHGREGWLARRAAQGDRERAQEAAMAIGGSQKREAKA